MPIVGVGAEVLAMEEGEATKETMVASLMVVLVEDLRNFAPLPSRLE